MSTPTYIRINNYDILDENGSVIESNLTMDDQAIIEADNQEVVYTVVGGGPVLRPKNPR